MRGPRNRRRSGGFFRPQPWLRSARDLPAPSARWLAGLVLAVIGVWTAYALATSGAEPSLPSSHAVLVNLKPIKGSAVTGSGHLIWYRSASLLVVAGAVRGLAPEEGSNVYLVPEPSCSGSRPAGTRLVSKVRANRQGTATFNQELLGVSNLKFSAWSIWVADPGHSGPPRACGVISLSNGRLVGP